MRRNCAACVGLHTKQNTLDIPVCAKRFACIALMAPKHALHSVTHMLVCIISKKPVIVELPERGQKISLDIW